MSSGLSKQDFGKFVQFFRQASPYVEGHRGKTFVIVIPGNVRVSANRPLLQSIMADIALLHGLGVHVILVVGAQQQIDDMLKERNMTPKYVGGYRLTDREAMRIAIEAAGQIRTTCEQFLSKGPAIPMFRRHTKGDGEVHFEPALRVISGNYITAKRRGVLDGVDFGLTGEVRFVLKDDIRRQLDSGNIVLLSNIGFTAAGEVLNCNTYDVGLHAAAELGADKLFFLHLDEVAALNLPQWLPLSEAQNMLMEKLQQMVALKASMDTTILPATGPNAGPPEPASAYGAATSLSASQLRAYQAMKREELVVDLDIWSAQGFPTAVSTCVVACCKGERGWSAGRCIACVKRAHLLDARIDGGLLLELYSRDGVGTMISADFYEGIRKALPNDLDGLAALLEPLEKAGNLVKRTREELGDLIPNFTVIERDNRILGAALLLDLGQTPDGVTVAEVGAFCVDPVYRGSGRGDSLLDYVEQDARGRGIQRLVLLTTRTADWFEQRDFRWQGAAFASELLPLARRARINPARNSQLYVKNLEAPADDLTAPGKRIGF
ncbi:hypothetical protein VOLCADRAFT_57336 [Volvox carteri f. nagariensis]|uniref:amino-acid N-acetyltransferase n=1 Tax=Volvox carteri f. nagariensis TaxID=3068 RepID=D8TN26_VOLCA|nr:uncharacterized protein VOLCADRAFT_57336 [Volvox carteri f. nagariensis]EFJ51352.1 hypothetical protein VOLCADRAFT_57336 [Volvox carteri f. nagariensis]|eukprot:XP_002947819.1 hypothetical protein VOLCADRAFT_57336 [Volvox carteri f. nagariensis]